MDYGQYVLAVLFSLFSQGTNHLTWGGGGYEFFILEKKANLIRWQKHLLMTCYFFNYYSVHTNKDRIQIHYYTDSSVMSDGFALAYQVMDHDEDTNCVTSGCNRVCGVGMNEITDYFGCCVCNATLQNVRKYVNRQTTTSKLLTYMYQFNSKLWNVFFT